MEDTFDRQRAALAADPDDVHAFEALQEHYFLEGMWEDLVVLYRVRLDSSGLADDPTRRVPLLFRLGQVLQERCERVAEAEQVYWDVARLDPNHRSALRQLRHIYASRLQWDMVLQTAELEGQIPMPPADHAAFLADLGAVWLDPLDDPAEAQACFEKALENDPHEQKALDGLARAHQRFGRHAEAAAVYQRLVAELRGPERAPALIALGKIHAGPLAETDQATKCFRLAMTDDPRNEDAVISLLLIATAREQWSLLADLYERRFDLAAGARQRALIAVEAGTMELEHLHDSKVARSWFERARELVDDDPVVYNAFAVLARTVGDDEALRRSLDQVIRVGGEAIPTSVLVEAAELHAESGDQSLALGYLQRAHERRPDDPLILEALSDALSSAGQMSDLADILERRAALASDDPEARADALLELSRILEEENGDPEGAIDALDRAFAANPSCRDITGALRRLYRKAERWEDLREVLERMANQASGADRGRLAMELGELLAEEMGDTQGAKRAFESVLEVAPDDFGALRGLETIARKSGDEDTLLRVCEAQALATSDAERLAALTPELVPLLEARHAPERAWILVQKLLDVQPDEPGTLAMAARLQEQLGLASDRLETLKRLDAHLDGSLQAANRRTIAELLRDTGDPEAALASLEAAIESDPTDIDSLRLLLDHYTETQRLQDVARIQRRLVDALPEHERAAALSELASLLEGPLGDVDGAIVVLWRLVDRPDRPEAAIERLESLLERGGRFADLAQQLAERRRGLPDRDPQTELLDLRRARLLMDQLGQLEDAATIYRAILAQNPDCPEAIENLERALRSSNDTAGLAELLEDRARSEGDPCARAHLVFERATLLEEAIGEDESALALFEMLAESDDEPSVAARASARVMGLLERRGDWSKLRSRLEANLGAGSETDDLELHTRLAALCRDRLGDREGCAEHLEAIGRSAPGRADVWRDLTQMYRELDRQEDLLRVMQAELATEPGPARGLVIHTRAARIHTAQATAGGDTRSLRDLARAHYECVLEIDPTHSEASEFLIEFYTEQDRPSEIARLIEARLAGCDALGNDDESTRLGLELRLAELRTERLGDRTGAIRILESALERGPAISAIATPLADLYESDGADETLSKLCRRALSDAASAAERTPWTIRLAESLTRVGQAEEAAEAYCEALADRPGDRDVEAALRDLYRGLDQPAALAALIETEIPRARPADQIALRVELAGLQSEGLDRPEEALEHLRSVLETDPEHDAAFAAALRLSERLGRQNDILALVDKRLDVTPPGPARARLMEQRGDLLAGALDRPEEAASAFREAVALGTNPQSARQSLRGVMERLGRWPAVLDCLHLEAQASAPEDRVAILERAVEIAREHVSLDATLPWLERLRAERPEDAAVVAQMADVHQQAGRPEALLRAIEQQFELVDDPSRRRELYVKRARTLERDLHAPGRAIQAYHAALRLAPDDPRILSELDRLCDLMGRVDERVEILERRIELDQTACRIELHRQAALLHATSLADPERAIPHLLSAIALCEGNAGETKRKQKLLCELAETLRAAGRVEAWTRAAGAELAGLDLELVADRQRAAQLHHELAIAYESELGLPNKGVRHLRALFELLDPAPGQEPVSLPTEQIARAESALIDRLRADQSHVELAQRLSARLARGGGETDEWLELGRLRAERLHAPAAAADAFREVLARQPANLVAIRGLRQVAELQCDWETVAHALELELDAPTHRSPHERAALHRRLGDVSWHRLGALARAASAYTLALEARPTELEILESLQTLEEQRGRYSEAIDLLEREIELLADRDPERRHSLWLRVATLARTAAHDTRRALRGFAEAEALAPLAPADQLAWAELFREDGDLIRFAETFASWCDDPAAQASAWDHLALFRTLNELGQPEAALLRARRACEVDPENAEAWVAQAGLLEEAGDRAEAASAHERAAELLGPREAAVRLVAAAALTDEDQPETIADLLRRATECDAGHAPAQAALANVAERLGEAALARTAAGRALDIARESDDLDRDQKLACALIGGRAARKLDHLDAAAGFFATALENDPRHLEALDAASEIAFEQGEWGEARRLVEARLELGGDDPRRALHLAVSGRGLEYAGDSSAAVARYREALDRDSSLDLAHEGLVRIFGDTGDEVRKLAALEYWIEHDDDASHRAGLCVQAAERHEADCRLDAAERLLRDAVSDDPGLEKAWTRLIELLEESERDDDVVEESARALAHVVGKTARARIALGRARILERRGENRSAAEAYGEAARNDSSSIEAALAEARLLRSGGDWNASAQAMTRFIAEHPDPDSIELAQVHLELGRLMSGPLEDVQKAIECYERALELCPDLLEAREPLAALLAHIPGRWQDAVHSHRQLLAEDPTRASSLRSLLEISRRRDDESATGLGLAILRGLGSASPEEATRAPSDLGVAIGPTDAMSDPIFETARRICLAAASEIAEALDKPESTLECEPSDSRTRAETTLRVCQGELSAPGISRLDVEELGSLIFTITALATDPGGNCNDGPFLHTLDESLGRWVRRKIRRTLGELDIREIQSIDYGAWRDELCVMAASAGLNSRDLDLRAALLTLSATPDSNEAWPPESADLSSLISGARQARALLSRVVDTWCDTILEMSS